MEVDKKLFFHLTDMTILNAFLNHKSCGGKMTHKIFCELFVRELIIHSQQENVTAMIIHLQEVNVTASGISRGRPSPTVSQLSRLEVKHSQHWPFKKSNGGVAWVRCTSKHGVHCISARSVT
jgi:hypothetical protein